MAWPRPLLAPVMRAVLPERDGVHGGIVGEGGGRRSNGRVVWKKVSIFENIGALLMS